MNERLITASEMKKLTGVKSSRLKYLHETGRILPVKVTEGGYRYYKQSQIIDILKEEKKLVMVAYNCIKCPENMDDDSKKEIETKIKQETEKLAKSIREYISDIEVTAIYDFWTGRMKNSNIEYLIKQAAKGLVLKIIIPSKDQFIVGDYNEFKKWLGYLNCELLDIEEFKQGEKQRDANKAD